MTALLPVTVASPALKASTVTVFELGTAFGAVYMPDELMVPTAALPPVTPLTCHVTEAFDDPETVALKDCVDPARTMALAGETVTVTLDPEEGAFESCLTVPVQPASVAATINNTRGTECRRPKILRFCIYGEMKKRRPRAEMPPH